MTIPAAVVAASVGVVRQDRTPRPPDSHGSAFFTLAPRYTSARRSTIDSIHTRTVKRPRVSPVANSVGWPISANQWRTVKFLDPSRHAHLFAADANRPTPPRPRAA